MQTVSLALAVTAACVCLATAQDLSGEAQGFLDQSQSGLVASYKIPSQGVWQSFTPSYSGSLGSVHVFLGAGVPSATCVPFRGRLSVYEGEGVKGSPSREDAFRGQALLHTQAVTSTDCRCTEQDCVVWQEWQLSMPLAVEEGKQYSFHVSAYTGQHKATPFRIGLFVADAYLGGSNDFVAPGYDYTFKTYMTEQRPDEVSLAEQPTGTGAGDRSTSSSSAGMNLPLVVGSVAAVVVLMALIIVVVQRRRKQGKKWMTVEEATAAWSERLGDEGAVKKDAPSAEAGMPHRRKTFGIWTNRALVGLKEEPAMPQKGDVSFVNNFVGPDDSVFNSTSFGLQRAYALPAAGEEAGHAGAGDDLDDLNEEMCGYDEAMYSHLEESQSMNRWSNPIADATTDETDVDAGASPGLAADPLSLRDVDLTLPEPENLTHFF